MDNQTQNIDWSKIPWEPMHKTYPLSLEQVFQNAWKAFVIEKRPPSYGFDNCIYSREINGCGCAIGVSLPDNSTLTQESVNHLTFGTLVTNNETQSEIERVFVDPHNDKRYWQLQSTHDRLAMTYNSNKNLSQFHKDIEEDLRDMAKTSNLTIPA